MAERDIRALIFDFGGVVLDMGWHVMAEIERRHGMPAGSVRRALWGHDTWRQREVGIGTLEDYLQAVTRELEASAGRPVPDAMAEWVAYERALNDDIIALADALRGRYKIGLLSNADERLEERLQDQLKIFDRFDDVVNSARVGMAKPDPRIFALAAERLGVKPEECVFVDDLERNIVAAREAGMYGIHYLGDNFALFQELRSLGIPVDEQELQKPRFYDIPEEWKAAMAAATSNVSS
jgi:putative hydrolase of the HAD superfamily